LHHGVPATVVSPAPRRRTPRSGGGATSESGGEHERLAVDGREVAISNPRKVLFPKPKYTKLDLVRYYLTVAEGALRGAGGRPNVLVRFPNGITGEFFYQKRAPESRPPWIDVVTLSFPSGRTAEEVVPRDAAALAWLANLACLELHPHPVRADDLDHPDELRVDLDPVPGVKWPQVRAVARVVQATLRDFGLTGWPKTSGSRGMHVIVRIERHWTFDEVRRAALALAREAGRPARGSRREPRFTRGLARAVGAARARRAGRRALAAALQEAARRAAARAAVPSPRRQVPVDRDRACQAQAGRARGAQTLEGASPQGRKTP